MDWSYELLSVFMTRGRQLTQVLTIEYTREKSGTYLERIDQTRLPELISEDEEEIFIGEERFFERLSERIDPSM